MSEQHEILKEHLVKFMSLNEKDLAEGLPFWKLRMIKKGDFFNMQHVVCNDLGLIIKGIFRIYYADPETLDRLAASGAVSRSAATAAKAVLSLMAGTGMSGTGDTEPPLAVDVLLTLQYRTLSMRQVPLIRLPELDWPGR